MNDHYYFIHLRDALTKGIEQSAEGIEKREAYLDNNKYLFLGTLLVGCFSYVESRLGLGWIRTYGQRHKRDFYVLRLIRNAFVHKNCDLTALNSRWLGQTIDESKGMPADINSYFQSYINDLNNGVIKDDKGVTFPVYITLDNGVVKLNDNAAHVITTLCIKLFHRHDIAEVTTT